MSLSECDNPLLLIFRVVLSGIQNYFFPSIGTETSPHRKLGVDHFAYDDAFYYFLASIGLVLLCFYSRSRVPGSEYQVWERRRQALREDEARVTRMNDPEYRMNLVLGCIVIKKISQEKFGRLLLDDEDSCDDYHTSEDGCQSIGNLEESANTCVICLEAFRVGDIVAWSRINISAITNEKCQHVFHEDCILSWLSHPMHDDCPYCRRVIVTEEPVLQTHIRPHSRSSMSDDSTSNSSRVFVIVQGLISRAQRGRDSAVGRDIAFDLSERGQCLDRMGHHDLSTEEDFQSIQENSAQSALRRRSCLDSDGAVSAPLGIEEGFHPISVPKPTQHFTRSVSDLTKQPREIIGHPLRVRPLGRTQSLFCRRSDGLETGWSFRDEEDEISVRHDIFTAMSTESLQDQSRSEELRQSNSFV